MRSQQFVDRQQIVDTLYRYGSSVDAKDYPTLRATFADDAVAQYDTAPEIHGADTIVKWIDETTLDPTTSSRARPPRHGSPSATTETPLSAAAFGITGGARRLPR